MISTGSSWLQQIPQVSRIHRRKETSSAPHCPYDSLWIWGWILAFLQKGWKLCLGWHLRDCIAGTTWPGCSFFKHTSCHLHLLKQVHCKGGSHIPGGGDGDPQGDEETAGLGSAQVHTEVQLCQRHQSGPCCCRWPIGCFKNRPLLSNDIMFPTIKTVQVNFAMIWKYIWDSNCLNRPIFETRKYDQIRNNASRNQEWYAEWTQTDTGVSRVKEWAKTVSPDLSLGLRVKTCCSVF